MKTSKKILSLLLAVIMIVCTAPMTFAEGNTYEVGDIIQFGSYPQSEVTDRATISVLNSKAPAWDDWISYEYYTYDWNIFSSVQGDWMRYIDVTYNGEKYRGIRFTKYRSSHTSGASYGGDPCQSNNGYYTDSYYWFKFEPVDWLVIDPAEGIVLCKNVIDSQPYSNTYYINYSVSDYKYYGFNDLSYSNYASDYKTSSIREWLNNDFYYTAFSGTERDEIITTTLNNDGYYTSRNKKGYEVFDSETTYDKIFLLSYNETVKYKSGLGTLMTKGSDYAKSQGLCPYDTTTSYPSSTYDGYPDWLLRTPGSHSSSCCSVLYYGSITDTQQVDSTEKGIRPALKLKNVFENSQSESSNSGNSSDNCSCMCHKTGFLAIIWKMLNIFNKILKKNYSCACGIAHY